MPLILMQRSPDFATYDDIIGEQYNYPSQYFQRIRSGERFIYCRPREGTTEAEKRESKTVYFGTGTIGSIRNDEVKTDHRYCEIVDYFEFPNEVEYREENGNYLETGTSEIPVMQSAVRVISKEAFDQIIRLSGLYAAAEEVYAKLETAASDSERLRALDEAYKAAVPKARQVLTRRIERGTVIGGRVKALNKYVCQICGFLPFTTPSGGLYAEAHHHTPLYKLEPESLAFNNVLCLCANCHRKMHYGNVKTISADEKTIVFEIDGKTISVKRNKPD